MSKYLIAVRMGDCGFDKEGLEAGSERIGKERDALNMDEWSVLRLDSSFAIFIDCSMILVYIVH